MSKKKETRAEEKPKPTFGQVCLEYGQAIFLAVALALIIRSFLLQAFQIPSGSMIPTFLEGDRVLVEKFAYGVRNPLNNRVWVETGRPERWDVVVFIYPEDQDKDFVKRVVGLPGETLALVNGEVFINGRKMDDPHGRFDPKKPSTLRNMSPVVIGRNQYFMMGDNRDHSSDSRVWGPVDFDLLKGKAWRLYWSWDSSDPDKSLRERLRSARIGQKVE
ncbi:MAG: signal peptidase I [Candidatus Adiutrix sp.]|jgi:signal peptidase I|nr:signal peptidase I [Candidatus Adiutrix sp.]